MLALAAPGWAQPRPAPDRLLDAIRQVETGGHARPADAVGDGGRSIGPYQIMRGYWRDACAADPELARFPYETVRDAAYARRVVLAYWKRYARTALARGDWQTLARIHNGGPAGARNPRTVVYWQRVARELNKPPRGQGGEMKHHVAISVDVDRFPDGYLEKHYVNGIKINGERVTVERFRELCAELRAEGMEVFPPCDHVDEKGFCKGHPAPAETPKPGTGNQ